MNPNNWKTLDEVIAKLQIPWWRRVHMWFLRFGIRRAIRQGKIRSYDACRQCLHPIHWNDDAGVCVKCGGRNERLQFTDPEKQS